MDVLRRSVLIFVPLLVVTAAVLYGLFHAQTGGQEAVIKANEIKIVEIARHRVSSELATLVSDARYLARQQLLQHWLSRGTPEARRELASDYLALARELRIYDQVRFLDERGREVVRVDRNAGSPAIEAISALQDKSDRYYVQETLKLDAGGVYVSPLDLNVERGAIEMPIKPMIRVGAPVFDANRQKRGMVVLNYLGEQIIDSLRSLRQADAGDVWLLNGDGYWLLGPTAQDEWAFMYPERRDHTFAVANPQAWQTITDGRASGQFGHDGAIFTYARVSAPESRSDAGLVAANAPRWLIVTHLSADKLEASHKEARTQFLQALAALALPLAGVSAVIGGYGARRRKAEKLVQESEARFRALLESAPDATVISDADGRILLVNAEAERIFGYGRDCLIGRPFETLIAGPYRDRYVEQRTRYLGNEDAQPIGEELALNAVGADGDEFPVAISISPVQAGQTTVFISDIRDVTLRREYERTIQELNERLTRDNASLATLNKELEAFSYTVSHDLRAPLRAIDGFSQALIEDCADQLDDAGRSHLARVRAAAQRMGELIDDLLKLSRITRTEVAVQEVDLSSMAEEIVENLRLLAPDRQVVVDIAAGMRTRGDARLLKAALENLLGNAWKFTANRSSAHIEFGRRVEGDGQEYYVRDNGAGFDMKYAEQLFRAFQRLHDVRAFPGSGIGLATVQRIIHKHGGQIRAEAAVDDGATFFFTLGAE